MLGNFLLMFSLISILLWSVLVVVLGVLGEFDE